MKRLVIFTALFAPIALVVFLWQEIWEDPALPPWEFVLTAYMIATVPGWLTATVDWALSVKLSILRVAGTTLAGLVIALVVGRFFGYDLSYPDVLHIGLTGAIPALVCSLLSRETRNVA